MDSVDLGEGARASYAAVALAGGTPMTTTEVAAAVDRDVDAVRPVLADLQALGWLEGRTVGEERIWWSVDGPGTALADAEPPYGSDPLDSLPALVYRCRQDEGWTMDVVRGNCEQVTGYAAAELEAGDVVYGTDIVHPADVETVWDAIEAVRGTDDPFTVQYRIRTKDGTTRWVWERGRFVGEEALVGVITDIDDQKRTEQTLREEQAFTESLLDAQQDVVYAYDREGELLRWNDRLSEVTGYDDSEIATMHSLDFLAEDERDRVQAELAPVLLDGATETVEFTVVTSDGEELPYELTAAPLRHDGDIIGVTGIGRDITARLHREAELRHERDVVERLLEAAPASIVVVDRDGAVVRANDRAIDRLGIDEGEGGYQVGDRAVYDEDGAFVPVEDRPYTDVFETERAVTDWHCQLDLPEIGRRWVSINAEPVFEDGEVTQVIVTSRDITRLKAQTRRLEQERDELESELSDVLERVQDAFIALDDQYRFTYVNEQAEQYLERSEAELLGESLWSQFPGAVDSTFEEHYRQAMADQEPVSFEGYYDPLDRWFRVNAYPSETGLSIYFRDVTRERAREAALRESQARYRTLTEDVLDTSEVGTFILDDDYEIVWVNRAIEEYFGLDRDDIVGRDKRAVIREAIADRIEDSERFTDLVTATYDDNTYTEAFECHVLDSDETAERWLRHWSQPIESGLYEGGRIEHYTDITDRVENASELERRVRQQEALAEFSRYALEDRPLDDVFDEAVALVADVLDHTYAKVLDLDAARDELRLRNGYGWDEDVIGEATVAADRGSQAGYARITEDPVVTEDLDAEERFEGPDLLTAAGVESGISTIIGDFESPWGVLETHATEHRTYADHDVQFVQSVANLLATAIDRHERERDLAESERRYRTLVENYPTGAVALLDTDLRFRAVGGENVTRLGLSGDELVGEFVGDIVPEPWSEELPPNYAAAADGERRSFEVVDDDRIFEVETLPVTDDDGEVLSVLGLSRDVTEEREREAELVSQREQLEAVNTIHDVVREITHAAFQQSTRDEIEQIACERLAETTSYEFAWIADRDPRSGSVSWRTGANTDDYESRVDLSLDDEGPTPRAFRTGEVQTVRDVHEDPAYAQWRDLADEYGFRSSAAIPIVHEDVVYGALNVYADRPNAFEEREGEVVAQLGETLGHAIAAVERKRALLSDDLVEIEVGIDDLFGRIVDHSPSERITIDEIVPGGEDEFLAYGRVEGGDVAPIEALVEHLPHWHDVRVVAEGDPIRYEAAVTDPPVLGPVASLGGSVEDVEIVDGDYFMRIRLPLEADSRRIVDTIRDTYPEAEILRHRQVSRDDPTARELTTAWTEALTDRQRAAITAAFHAGYFSWPRDTAGEDVADSLGVSAPTFYQHLRAAEEKLFGALLDRTDSE